MAYFVPYYRVSTQAQGRSGLGLEAQRSAVGAFIVAHGGEVLEEFTEVESARSGDRVQLRRAMDLCKVRRAILVIARLDRLARNVHFISRLMESGIDFVAADMPTANKLTIHIIAAMAEYERDLISERTKRALQAAKSRGTVLGNPRIRTVSADGTAARIASANAYATRIFPLIDAQRKIGRVTYAKIADGLNDGGVPTQRGRRWTPAGVRNIVKRMDPSRAG